MKDHIKTVYTEVHQKVDSATGELIEESHKKVDILVDPDDFCLIYSGLWNVLLDNPLSKADIDLLAYLIKHYSDNTPFTINGFMKKEISLKTGKSETSYNNSTRSLIKHGLIYEVGVKTYKLNPRYAFKGSSKNRHKAVINMRTICRNC